MLIKNGIGLAFNFLATSNAIGATIMTVATFSVKLDMKLERSAMNKIAIPTFLDLETSLVARNPGTLEYINKPERIIEPKNTPKTLKFMLDSACFRSIAWEIKSMATPLNSGISGLTLRLNNITEA